MVDDLLQTPTTPAAAPPAELAPGERFAAGVSIEVDGQWHELATTRDAEGGVSGAFRASWHSGAGDVRTCRIRRADGEPMNPKQVDQVCVEVTLPLLNFAHVVVPDCGRHWVFTDRSLHIRAKEYRVSANNMGHPFFAVTDELGRFMLGLGIVSAAGEVSVRRVLPLISNRVAMVGGDNVLLLRMFYRPDESAGSDETLDVELVTCDDAPTWHHALRRFTDAVRQREGITYPEHPEAWEPVWCTWTSFPSAELTPERVIENASACRELGIKSVILDDGWFGCGLDDDANEPLNLGGYRPDPTKIPDLAALVKSIQRLDVRAILWHAPLCVAPTSPVHEPMKRYFMRIDGKEYLSVNGLAQLCPACPEVRQYVVDETKRLFREYGIDGLKVDLYNCLPPTRCESTDHTHDFDDPVAAVAETMRLQWETARQMNPDVLFELKQDYGNVRTARFGTMVRAGDTAFDVDTNLRRCFYTQAAAPVVHNDYLATSVHTAPDALAMLVQKMIVAGVPTFGIELTRLSDEQRAIIRHWLTFYREHLAMFQQPREPQVNDLSAWQGGDASTAWVAALWHANTIRLPEAKRTFVFNCTGHNALRIADADGQRYALKTHDHAGKLVIERTLDLVPGTTLALAPANVAELTPAT